MANAESVKVVYISGWLLLGLFVGIAIYRILTSRMVMNAFGIAFMIIAISIGVAAVLGVIYAGIELHHRARKNNMEIRARAAVVGALEDRRQVDAIAKAAIARMLPKPDENEPLAIEGKRNAAEWSGAEPADNPIIAEVLNDG